MSYVANQYNYATPLSSVAGLVNETSVVDDVKYFTLSDNILDGSYRLISGDVGLWGTSVSDSSGALPTPFVVTVTETLAMNAFRLTGSTYCYPVAFTVKLYNGSTLLYTITETANNLVEYVYALPRLLNITKYELSITSVSEPGKAVRLYNLYNPGYVKRVDSVKVKSTETGTQSSALYLSRADSLHIAASQVASSQAGVALVVHGTDILRAKETTKTIGHHTLRVVDSIKNKLAERSHVINTIDTLSDSLKLRQSASTHILNTIDVTRDGLKCKAVEDISHVTNIFDTIHKSIFVKNIDNPILTNVHSRMKDPSRKIYGKVYITYTDPMLESETTVETNMEAYNSMKDQVVDGVTSSSELLFTLYDNNLEGGHKLMSNQSELSKACSKTVSSFNSMP